MFKKTGKSVSLGAVNVNAEDTTKQADKDAKPVVKTDKAGVDE